MEAGVRSGKPWNWLLFPFSSVKAGQDSIYAASVGHGVYEWNGEDSWEKLGNGLPEQANVHRLQLHSEMLHACTNEGLFQLIDGEWSNTGLAVPCYQYRLLGSTSYAGTEYGLWTYVRGRWEQTDCHNKRVYDFMNLPQYLIVGHESGISLYDRFMDEWVEFKLDRAVTSLSVYRGHLIGASDKGELMIGDKKGRFDRIRFGNHFIFSICASDNELFVCTDHGLFRLAYIHNQITLLSVKLGFPVTDIDRQGETLYMATLFQGIQSMEILPVRSI